MAVFDLFSARKRAVANAGKAEVYQYDKITPALRVQLQQILRDAIGGWYVPTGYHRSPPNNNLGWEMIHRILLKEKGRHRLMDSYQETSADDVLNYIGSASSTDDFLDAVEVCLDYLDHTARRFSAGDRREHGITQDAASAIEESNERFRRAGFGFQFEAGMIFRVDSEYVHAEVVIPSLRLLSEQGYEGPQKEFLEAHKHYREGNFKDAITWAGKAFESTMKAICERKRWTYASGARATDLLKVLRSHHLWPEYLDASFDQLLSTLKSGLPQVRNEVGAHGDGPDPKVVPAYVARYALNLAATKILLMAEAAKS